jgi:phytoene synthase
MDCRPRSTGGVAWAASQLASSAHHALGDDALKDFDNAGWVVDLPRSVQSAWLQRIRAIRLADRLAENQQLDAASRRFDRFIESGGTGEFVGEGPEVLAAWSSYVAALRKYHRKDLRLPSLADHRAMLDRLSGSLFQLVPFLSPPQFDAIRGLGALDQFFNNLRDLAEDAAHGICYFPDDVLAQGGLRREDVLGDGWRSTPRWPKLMRFWLDEYLPELERAAARFSACDDLHPSVARLRKECRARYLRILTRFRAVGFDFRRFAEEYWREVRDRAELAANPIR